MCSNKGVVYGLVVIGRVELRRLFGGYMLHYIPSVCVRFLRGRLDTATLQVAHPVNFLYFVWFPELLLHLPLTHTPCSKPAANANESFFPPLYLFCVSSLLKVSQREMCLEGDVYVLYVAECFDYVRLYHLRQLLQLPAACSTDELRVTSLSFSVQPSQLLTFWLSVIL